MPDSRSETDAPDATDSSSAEATVEPSRSREPRDKSAGQGIGEWIGIFIAALLVAFLVRTFVVQNFWIPSGSMEQTLQIGDRILANKLAYRFDNVHRGDIVVFRRPPGEHNEGIDDLIKRVIAIPGDTVEGRNGLVYVNGQQISENYLQPGVLTQDLPLTKIPADEYWVMGDNRGNSSDSRVFGPISKDLIVGKASFRIWPLDRVGTF